MNIHLNDVCVCLCMRARARACVYACVGVKDWIVNSDVSSMHLCITFTSYTDFFASFCIGITAGFYLNLCFEITVYVIWTDWDIFGICKYWAAEILFIFFTCFVLGRRMVPWYLQFPDPHYFCSPVRHWKMCKRILANLNYLLQVWRMLDFGIIANIAF